MHESKTPNLASIEGGIVVVVGGKGRRMKGGMVKRLNEYRSGEEVYAIDCSLLLMPCVT